MKRNEHAKALELLEELVDMSPGFAEAHFLIGQAYAGLYKNIEAITNFRTAVELNSHDKRAKMTLDHYTEDSSLWDAGDHCSRTARVTARRIGHVALLVRDYDEAIALHTKCLRFTLLEDTDKGSRSAGVLVFRQVARGRRCSWQGQARPNRGAA